MAPPPLAALGRIGGLVELEVAGKKYLHVLPPPEPQPARPKGDGCGGPPAEGSLPVMTLLLFAPSEAASEELEVSVRCSSRG